MLNYIPLSDTRGRAVHPGDRVVYTPAPKRKIRGTVRLSSRPRETRGEGDYVWHLDLLGEDGLLYALPDAAVIRRLAR